MNGFWTMYAQISVSDAFPLLFFPGSGALELLDGITLTCNLFILM